LGASETFNLLNLLTKLFILELLDTGSPRSSVFNSGSRTLNKSLTPSSSTGSVEIFDRLETPSFGKTNGALAVQFTVGKIRR